MRLSTTQQGLGWSETLMESTSLDLPKPAAPTRRNQQQQQQQQHTERLECPRCGSTNTKFCYYNNYNKSQPRHFCKACKRHWTKGGTLRNVPVGGGRKNKRVKVSSTDTRTNNLASVVIPKGGINGDAHTFEQSQRDGHALSDQKSISDTLLQALIHPSSSLQNDHEINGLLGKAFMVSNGGFSGSILMPSQDQSIQMSFSTTNAFSITTPSQKSKGYEQFGRLDASLESTITTVLPTTSSILSQPWQNIPATSGAMDMPSYWSWNDIDSLVSADDLGIPWNDTELKF